MKENIMKRTLIRLLIIVCLFAAGGLNSVAQEKKPRPDESRPQKPGQIEFKAPPDGTFKLLGPKFAIGKVVKGAPYSATATTETIQTLSDGNQIIRKNESKLYRDSEGRTRIEQTLETIGKWTAFPTILIRAHAPRTRTFTRRKSWRWRQTGQTGPTRSMVRPLQRPILKRRWRKS